MPFFYLSGGRVLVGGRVLLHGEPGEIEFVADPADDAENRYVTEFGGGVMVIDPRVFGSLFIPAPVTDYEELELVSRAGV